MAYLFRHSPAGHQMLVEMTSRDAKLAIAGQHDQARHGVWFERCSAQKAHAWVRADGLHSTPLWIDAGRIRRS